MKNPDISLHHLTIVDSPVPEFLRIAGKLGCSRVSLFANDLGYGFPVVDADSVAEVGRILEGEGLSVASIAVFVIGGQTIDEHRRQLEIAGRLGAGFACTVVRETDRARAAAEIEALAGAARDHGIDLGIEFLRGTAGCPDLATARELVCMTDSSNVGILLDTTHFIRSGGSVAELETCDLSRVGYVHLADGPRELAEDQFAHEVIHDRLAPGEGEFPLIEIVKALPAPHVFEVEAPMRRSREAGESAESRARRAIDGARKIVAAAAHA